MANEPVVHADLGTPDQLPYGAATALNEAAANAPGPPPEPQAAAPALPEPIQPATPADYEPLYQPESEDDAFITGPTLRPDEPQTAGTTARLPVPENVKRALPLLQQAANEPNADPQLRAIVAFLARELSS